MFGSRFNSAKCETTCRLCVGRIKLIRNKKTVQLKQSQKDIAELLRSGKQEYARIRVEGVIREKLLMQAYEILELYLELMTVRAQLISKTKELPRDMMEAVSSIIYAAQRIADLPELSTLRQLFAAKYGKEYAMEAAADATTAKWAVNANLIRCLLVEAPQPEDKLAALSEIAQEYGVEWDLSAAARDMGVGASPDVGLGGGAPGAGGFPPGPPPSYGSGGSGHGNGGGGGGSVPVPAAMPAMPPPAAPGQYTNAQQAAAAAAQAAAQARAAADYAAQVAAEMGAPMQTHAPVPGGPPPPTGWLVQPPAGAPPGHAGLPPPALGADFLPTPPSGPVGALRTGQPGLNSEGSGTGSGSGGLPTPPHPHSTEPSTGSGGGAVGGYIVRSNEEIQRAYDAALGPPTKGQSAAPTAPPTAPPAPAAPPAAPPAPPAALAAPAPPPAVEDEYELLTKRLEALKRS